MTRHTDLAAADHQRADVVVIGAGQAGLSAGYHLLRRSFTGVPINPATPTNPTGPTGSVEADTGRSFVILDGEDRPGGAWLHRWPSLTMATVNGIFDLPGLAQPTFEPNTPARQAVPEYFAAFEHQVPLPILRPVRVTSVSRLDDAPDGELLVRTDRGAWRTRAVINATGTWTNPTLPQYPGRQSFTGRQLHTKDYRNLEEFAGQRVAIVGGGISAVQQLEEISRVAQVFWYTRREPVFRSGEFDPQVQGREVIAAVTADVEAGRRTGSVVSYTGLAWTPDAVTARERGVLRRRPMFTRIEPDGVRNADGSFTAVDTILWATGFRAALGHLDPLRLQNEHGGVELRGTAVAADPRIHLVGFGPSQSTVGANRAGRDAVRALLPIVEQDGAGLGAR